MLCCYVNGTQKMLIARIANSPNYHFERVIFPQERYLFKAPPNAQLEIHRHSEMGMTLADSIPCNYLRVSESRTSRSSEAIPSKSA
ncbi:DUF1830 domain-containing protein [Coleofasciculus sp. LEGE 07092]|nr:DUF1830 domain-containing protein [Coleofasciculus sp. LEGE 07081]MBE9148842.1 DUF1830 domain-containing protein [Coleofasciculus sp. LEGE 07092]